MFFVFLSISIGKTLRRDDRDLHKTGLKNGATSKTKKNLERTVILVVANAAHDILVLLLTSMPSVGVEVKLFETSVHSTRTDFSGVTNNVE